MAVDGGVPGPKKEWMSDCSTRRLSQLDRDRGSDVAGPASLRHPDAANRAN